MFERCQIFFHSTVDFHVERGLPGESTKCRRRAPFEPRDQIKSGGALKPFYSTQWLSRGDAQNLHVYYMIGPADCTDAPLTPLVERVNPVIVRQGNSPRLGGIWSNGSDANVVESYLRWKCHTGPPYAVEIPHGSSGRTKTSEEFRVCDTMCSSRRRDR